MPAALPHLTSPYKGEEHDDCRSPLTKGRKLNGAHTKARKAKLIPLSPRMRGEEQQVHSPLPAGEKR